MRLFRFAAAALAAVLSAAHPLAAQFAGTPAHDNFRDTSVLRPPAGVPVAIMVWEDLGCPACARDHPIELQASEKFHVPVVRYDFPLAAHVWTFDGAVYARYIQDRISPQLAGEFRTQVFAAQMQISGKEDIKRFTESFLKKHNQPVPFVYDPAGSLAKEVQADFDLGRRLNVEYTPTIVVVTRNNYQVIAGTQSGPLNPGGNNIQDLFTVVPAAQASAPAAAKSPTKLRPPAHATQRQ